MIDGDGGRLQDVYSEDVAYMAPPVLQKEGWRVQPEWLFGFLRNPSETLRPWLDVRMPTFPLGDEQATGLVRAFAAGAGVSYPYLTVEMSRMSEADHAEAQKMVDGMLNCFKCHTAGEPAPDQDRASLAPDLRKAKRRLRPDWVLEWIRNPQALQEGTRMPAYFSLDDPSTEMYPDYFGGSQEKQIVALRNFVMALPDENASAPSKSKTGSRAVPTRRGR
jgi:mono/diheme cytochrome c family protein